MSDSAEIEILPGGHVLGLSARGPLNRRRPFRSRDQVRQRHTAQLVSALIRIPDWHLLSSGKLAEALYDQGVRVKLS